MHGFLSQGFAKSNQNNYLTMRTSEGSAAMTDGGFNVSTNLMDRLRVGAQAYTRNVGDLSNFRVELDWAFADYRFKDWLGVRAGKVKTSLGLINDTQDMEFLHTWALLPQSVYPVDLRASTIAHMGGDLYGEISLKSAGTLTYTAFAGLRPDDPRGGYRYGLRDFGMPMTTPITGRLLGTDLRWTTPIPGLTTGFSYLNGRFHGEGLASMGPFKAPYRFDTTTDNTYASYADYQNGNLHLTAEYRRNPSYIRISGLPGVPASEGTTVGWYGSGAYRVTKWLELGTYHSRYRGDVTNPDSGPKDHIFDTVATARFDINRFWSVKVEQHFMDGYGNPISVRGFYLSTNPTGLQPKTNLFIVRTGFSF